MDIDTTVIDAQIAALQAERAKKVFKAEYARREREKEEAKVLIHLTPTKPALKGMDLPMKSSQPIFVPHLKPAQQSLPSVPEPGPSRMSNSLAVLRRSTSSSTSALPQHVSTPRSSSFSSRLSAKSEQRQSFKRGISADLEVEDKRTVSRDGDNLAIIEELVPGPREFGRDPEGEEEWLHLEPNSSIRLTKRVLPHASLQEHLSGRYYLSPSLLYSVIRLSRDGATYDVPVEGDWVVIAVVAERGEVKVGGTKEDVGSDEENDTGRAALPKQVKGQKDDKVDEKTKEKDKWKKRRGPRKYINLKLCALPPRSKSTSTTSGPSGDAMLQLLLFEADSVVRENKDGDGELERSYRGGSGGAYEKWCNLGVGSVIAVLNPRVLRPLRSGSAAPHPLTLPLALNPTSPDAITLIGQARDLGCCSAQQKDGNRCKTWVDLRQSQVCEYHVHAAVHRSRAGRAEFTASTNGFSLQTRGAQKSTSAKNAGYDPTRRTGLLPAAGPQVPPRTHENGGGGATYIVSGNTVNTHRSDGGLKYFGEEHLSEKLGRGRAGKKKRKMEEKEAEEALGRLLEGDGGRGSTGAKYLAVLDKRKTKVKKGIEGEEGKERKMRPFSAGAIKKIGFDPTSRGPRDGEDVAKRLETIASLKENPDRPIKLGRPKGLGRSNVRAPLTSTNEGQVAPVPEAEDDLVVDEGMIDLE